MIQKVQFADATVICDFNHFNILKVLEQFVSVFALCTMRRHPWNLLWLSHGNLSGRNPSGIGGPQNRTPALLLWNCFQGLTFSDKSLMTRLTLSYPSKYLSPKWRQSVRLTGWCIFCEKNSIGGHFRDCRWKYRHTEAKLSSNNMRSVWC